MAFKVVVRMGVNDVPEDRITSVGAKLCLVPLLKEDDIIANASDADAVLVGAAEPFTKRVIKKLSKCKVISRMGIGYDNIDVRAATEEGIAVTVVDDASIDEVSDHAMAFLLAFARKLFSLNHTVKARQWQPGLKEIDNIRSGMRRLNQQTLGLVGVGRIGRALIRKAKAFGLRILFNDPYVSDETARELGIESVDFQRLLREADFISLHAPLTPETHHLFGLAQFKMMKPSAYVINTARGGLIDQDALYHALKEGLIAGAGLDVTSPEPLPTDSPLLSLDNVIITAHSAFCSDMSQRELRTRAADAVVTALKGTWPASLVNPEVKERADRRIRNKK